MKNKLSLKLIMMESFLPFLISLFVFFIFLYYIDNVIKYDSRKTLVINLNAKQESESERESTYILKRIDTARYSGQTAKKISRINRLVKRGEFRYVIKKIRKLPPHIQNGEDIRLLLTYCYYKIGKLDMGLKILDSFTGRGSIRIKFYYALIYGRDHKTYDKAVENYLAYLKENPASYEGHSNTGILYYKKKEYEKSLKHFRDAAKISAGKRKAVAFYRMGLNYVKIRKPVKAKRAFLKSIKLDPMYIKPRKRLARIKYKQSPDSAVKDYRKILSIDLNYIRGYYVLGKYYYERGKITRSVRILKKGISISHQTGILRSYLGYVYLQQKEHKNAHDIYEKLVREFPENETFHFNLARSFYGLKDYGKAIYQYKRAIALKKSYFKAIVNTGVTYSKMKDYRNAIKYYNIARSYKPYSPTIFYNLGILYSKQGDTKRSLESFRAALKLKPHYPESLFNMGHIYSSRGDTKSAIQHYLKAIDLNKKYVSPYINLFILRKKTGEEEKSEKHLLSGIKNTGSAKLKNILAKFYLKRKNYKESIKLYEDVLENDRKNQGALYGLARVYNNKKDYRKSIKYIKKYIFLKPKGVKGRYLYMVTLYNMKNYREALKQVQVIDNLKKNYRNNSVYKEKIIRVFNSNN